MLREVTHIYPQLINEYIFSHFWFLGVLLRPNINPYIEFKGLFVSVQKKIFNKQKIPLF